MKIPLYKLFPLGLLALGTALIIPFINNKAKENIRLKNQTAITCTQYQDINRDGTNELQVFDISGRKTTLFKYDIPEAGITNQYFSLDTIREIEQRQLEKRMRGYTNMAGGQTR